MMWAVFRYTRNKKLETNAEIIFESLVLACNKCQGGTMTSVKMVIISLSEWICKIIIFWCHCSFNKQIEFFVMLLFSLDFFVQFTAIRFQSMTFYFHLGY